MAYHPGHSTLNCGMLIQLIKNVFTDLLFSFFFFFYVFFRYITTYVYVPIHYILQKCELDYSMLIQHVLSESKNIPCFV